MFPLVRSQAGGEVREVGLGKEEQAVKKIKNKTTWDFREKRTHKVYRKSFAFIGPGACE